VLIIPGVLMMTYDDAFKLATLIKNTQPKYNDVIDQVFAFLSTFNPR